MMGSWDPTCTVPTAFLPFRTPDLMENAEKRGYLNISMTVDEMSSNWAKNDIRAMWTRSSPMCKLLKYLTTQRLLGLKSAHGVFGWRSLVEHFDHGQFGKGKKISLFIQILPYPSSLSQQLPCGFNLSPEFALYCATICLQINKI